jgi:hypothetical protein
MKKNNYFDQSKSLVENAYYLLMVVSIVFVVIQLMIARDSMRNSANLELTQHTIEQNNHYRITIEGKIEEFIAALRTSPYPVDQARLEKVAMYPANLEEMTLSEGMTDLLLFSDELIADSVEMERVYHIQNKLATELDQYAFFILNGFLFEELAYRDMGYNFIRGVNFGAVPSIYAQSYGLYNLYQVNIYRHVRQLYDIWWHREQIDKRRNRIDMCRIVLAGDERKMEFLRQGQVAELSFTPEELHATIRQMETEIATLETALASRIAPTSIRNL